MFHLMKVLRCKLTHHRFGDWEYRADNLCDRVRYCYRCGEKQITTSSAHYFFAWKYVADNSCIRVSYCERCGKKGEEILHQFDEWKYIAAHSCEQQRTCSRDGYIEKKAVAHLFDWARKSDCEERLMCTRCGHNSWEARYSHDWVLVKSVDDCIVEVAWLDGECRDLLGTIDYYTCSRCPETKEVSTPNYLKSV